MMTDRRTTSIGAITAIFIFFLGLLVHNQMNAPDGNLGQALLLFAAVAVPGGLFIAWLAGKGRRRR
ncbi:hypothetical protein ACFUJR_11575 [Streptomyces sp. NPDC057271]|uniref:hypothetical protein n=1 Tax=unclassified Streptomyces TaxID=2593676 RepID=UPI003629D482